jgi:hypothetical protein
MWKWTQKLGRAVRNPFHMTAEQEDILLDFITSQIKPNVMHKKHLCINAVNHTPVVTDAINHYIVENIRNLEQLIQDEPVPAQRTFYRNSFHALRMLLSSRDSKFYRKIIN